MKFEYRYLSEERAAEIDAMGIITPNGQKLRINYARCITNEDESIVFQIIFIAVPHPNDDLIDIDQYLLFYKGYQYTLKIKNTWSKKKENEEYKYHTKWIIESEIEEKEDCLSEEVLSVLIDILCELSRHRSKKIIEGTVEIIYKGKRVK
ncbi:MAG: hypothetical protein K2K21_00160 [Lachnospiraceae bacterium]|nr:hypothetical protein [Lachnospiraceae bacterium]